MNPFYRFQTSSNVESQKEKRTSNAPLSEAIIVQQLQRLMDEQKSLAAENPEVNQPTVSPPFCPQTHLPNLTPDSFSYSQSELQSWLMINSQSDFPPWKTAKIHSEFPQWTTTNSQSERASLTPSDGSYCSQNDLFVLNPEATAAPLVPSFAPENSFYSQNGLFHGSSSYATFATDSMSDLSSLDQQPFQPYSSYALSSTAANPFAHFGTNAFNYEQTCAFSNTTGVQPMYYNPNYFINELQPSNIMPSMSSFIQPTQSQNTLEANITPKKSVSTGTTRRHRQKKNNVSQRKMSAKDNKTCERDIGGINVNAALGGGSSKTNYKKGRNVEKACNHCKRSHLRCDNLRPCGRCVTTGKHDCHDVAHKPRGRPRGPKK